MQNDQQKRLLIAIGLTTVLSIAYMQFLGPKTPPGGVSARDAGAAAPSPAPPTPPAASAQPPAAPAPDAPAAVPLREQSVSFETPAQRLVFSTRGGALSEAIVRNGGKWPERKFLSRQKDGKGEGEPVNMVRVHAGAPLPGSTEIKGDLALPIGTAYELEEGKGTVTFRTATPELALEKRYRTSANGYEVRLEVALTNRAAAPKRATVAVAWPAWVDPKTQESGSFFSPRPESSETLCRHGDTNDKLGTKKETKVDRFQGPVRFAGFDERYFMGVVFPRFAEGTSCALMSDPSGNLDARVEADLGTLAPGQTVKREFGFYIGPKSLDELKRVSLENEMGGGLTPLGEEPKSGGEPAFDPQLGNSIDFGWWAVICRVLLGVMKVFQKAVVNWGIAIVLLTVLVKAILYPLSVKQMASMEAMRKLQPQMDALSKKYANDKEKLNLERMKLFQENKVNPFGGCLPLIIQMPVWIALYQTLLSSFELYREPLLKLWISDLTARDPYYIMPLAMGVTMFITQKMQPQMGDPTQAKIMLYFMPIFFTSLMLSLPAGLTLYIFTNNLLSIAQQKYLQHRFAAKRAAASS